MTDEIPVGFNQPSDYETAWKELVGLLGGSIDGCAQSAERGSSEASRDMQVWNNIEETIDMVADEHNVEGLWNME